MQIKDYKNKLIEFNALNNKQNDLLRKVINKFFNVACTGKISKLYNDCDNMFASKARVNGFVDTINGYKYAIWFRFDREKEQAINKRLFNINANFLAHTNFDDNDAKHPRLIVKISHPLILSNLWRKKDYYLRFDDEHKEYLSKDGYANLIKLNSILDLILNEINKFNSFILNYKWLTDNDFRFNLEQQKAINKIKNQLFNAFNMLIDICNEIKEIDLSYSIDNKDNASSINDEIDKVDDAIKKIINDI